MNFNIFRVVNFLQYSTHEQLEEFEIVDSERIDNDSAIPPVSNIAIYGPLEYKLFFYFLWDQEDDGMQQTEMFQEVTFFPIHVFVVVLKVELI